jgi:maltose O-acetyltransferase
MQRVVRSESFLAKLARIIREETNGIHLRLLLIRMLIWPLPHYTGSRLRVRLFRLAGFKIGRGCVMWGTPTMTGSHDLYNNLTVGEECWFNVGCFLDLGAPITIGDRIAFGHQVIVLTSSHRIGPSDRRAGPLYAKPVTIGDGAWVGARSIILPGVHVGSGAIVAAGALVNSDVPPNTMVAGVPARVVKTLPQVAVSPIELSS